MARRWQAVIVLKAIVRRTAEIVADAVEDPAEVDAIVDAAVAVDVPVAADGIVDAAGPAGEDTRNLLLRGFMEIIKRATARVVAFFRQIILELWDVPSSPGLPPNLPRPFCPEC